MSYPGTPYPGIHRSKAYQALSSNVVDLSIRQHPLQAVVTPEHKEKMRKPVDPPPIIQLKVDTRHDMGKNFLVNPFLFMTAMLVEPEKIDHEWVPIRPNPLIGSFVSSLHRLKDVDNKDGGFFVFGDISCRREGTFRLLFSLFELRPEGTQTIYSIHSDKFQVVPLKEFKGLMESTHLSRTFSDQGVRLRLRKEPRTLTGNKRTWDASADPTTSPHYQTAYGGAHDDHAFAPASIKRQRSDSDVASQGYPPGPFSGGPVSHYTPGGGSAWGGYASHGYHAGQYSSGMMAATPTQSAPGWQRPYQPPMYSGAVDSNAGHGYSSSPISATPITSAMGEMYPESRSQQYTSRMVGDPYTAGYGLETPTSGSDSGLLSHQPSNPTPISMGSGMQGSAGHYGMQPYQTYPPAPQGVASNPYQASTQQTMLKYETAQYSSNQYTDSVREPYTSVTSSLSDTNLSLNTGLLNRSFAPASHPPNRPSGMSGFPEDDFTELKTQQQAYPTPHHTSPLT